MHTLNDTLELVRAEVRKRMFVPIGMLKPRNMSTADEYAAEAREEHRRRFRQISTERATDD